MTTTDIGFAVIIGIIALYFTGRNIVEGIVAVKTAKWEAQTKLDQGTTGTGVSTATEQPDNEEDNKE